MAPALMHDIIVHHTIMHDTPYFRFWQIRPALMRHAACSARRMSLCSHGVALRQAKTIPYLSQGVDELINQGVFVEG